MPPYQETTKSSIPASTEESLLLPSREETGSPARQAVLEDCIKHVTPFRFLILTAIVVLFASYSAYLRGSDRTEPISHKGSGVTVSDHHPTNSVLPPKRHSKFPEHFVWGSATSSYQIEGAVEEDGRGPSIWDAYCDKHPEAIADHSSGAVACDHYHRMEHDVQLMKKLGLKAYRFSIAWPRIFPEGTGPINEPGVDFYDRLISTLLDNGIEPWVTLYHWDLPQALQEKYGGWMDPQCIDDFVVYARTCFELFGDRVTRWITLNESWTVAVGGYSDFSKAPGRTDTVDPGRDTYIVGHHLILAHAKVAKMYKESFQWSAQNADGGLIGISNCGDYRYPTNPENPNDVLAAERAMVFQFAWFTDPILLGDYPDEMKEKLGDRLPKFTDDEKKILVGNTDFIGLNHYSSMDAAHPLEEPDFDGYWADIGVNFTGRPKWPKTDMGWYVVPDGCRELLLWIDARYDRPQIVMTENGVAVHEPDKSTALDDEFRRLYFETYLRACAQAMAKGVQLAGYFAWSFMDNFEWEYGYTKRFGICRVDYETQERIPKKSALWYSKTVKENGRNL